jgi:hypothetical protein
VSCRRAVVNGCAARLSNAIRTARAFNSGVIYVGMAPSSSTHKEAAQNP